MRTTAFVLSWIAITELAPPLASRIPPDAGLSSEPIDLEVAVQVAETCSVAPVVTETAQRTAVNLFDRIGVRLSFMTSRQEHADSGIITLHVLNRAPKKLTLLTVGVANIDPGRADAFVFCDRVTGFYHTVHDKEIGVLLGYAIAHELGHVLLGTASHSPEGVMRACWRQTDVILMLQRVIGFSRADAEHIHAMQASHRIGPLYHARGSEPGRNPDRQGAATAAMQRSYRQ